MQTMTNHLQERRKVALLLPVVVVPCLVFAFYGLGGGKGPVGATAGGLVRGVNMSLPAAQLDAKKPPDKLQLYEKAAADSARRLEAEKLDPYAAAGWRGDNDRRRPADSLRGLGLAGPAAGWNGERMGVDQRQPTIDVTTDQVMARVAELKKLMAAPAAGSGWPERTMSDEPAGATLAARKEATSDGPLATRREVMSEGLQGKGGLAPDPEMERIDAMLDKLIRIQHPGLVERDTGTGKSAGPVLLFTVPKQEEAVLGLGTGSAAEGGEAAADVAGSGTSVVTGGFIEIGDGGLRDSVGRRGDEALEATIDGDQTVTGGAWVALRLSREARLGGVLVPAGQLLTGEASLSGERLKVHIGGVRVVASILPVDLQVYDLDGVAGIRIPGAMTRDVAKESTAEAMSGLGLASMDPSLTGQAANAGLQLAKTLTSRKLRAVRVALPAGYRVLLRNNKTGL